MSKYIETTISISLDNVWAGSGKLRRWADESVEIVDCGAQFAEDYDDSEAVYESIQDAIESGSDSLQTDAGLITWTIGE